MSPTNNIEFTCPACAESLLVDEPIRDALVEAGCVVCGGDVTARSFASG